MELSTRSVGIGIPEGTHVHLLSIRWIERHGLMADNGLIVLEIRNAEVTQHRGAFETGAFVQRHDLRTIFALSKLTGVGNHHRRTRVTFRTQLRQENIVEFAAVNALNKQHGVPVGCLLELPLS